MIHSPINANDAKLKRQHLITFYKILITTCDNSLFSINKKNKENFDLKRKKKYDNYK